jgi:hypothetical protein
VKLRTTAAAFGVIALIGASAATAETGETTQLANERVNFKIGCVTEGSDPRCVSTSYELSTSSAGRTVGNLLNATPLGYAFHKADGAYTTQPFNGDKTLRSEYVLEAGTKIPGQITLTSTGAPPVAADSGVLVVLRATVTEEVNGRTRSTAVTIGEAEVTKVLVTPVPGDNVYKFEFTVPDALDGVAVSRLSADVGQRHINAGYGFMNGQGGSFFDLPHVVPVETEEPAPAS